MINVRDKVLVTSECATFGLKGIVKKVYGNHATVKLENGFVRNYNVLSLYKEDKMSVNNFKNCLNFVSVRFTAGTNTSASYTFANYIEGLEAGDLVVCDTARGYSLARVVAVDVAVNNVNVTREIVERVDTKAFEIRVARRKQLEELKARLDQRAAALQTTAIYEMLAEKDEEMAMLLDAYKVATGGK